MRSNSRNPVSRSLALCAVIFLLVACKDDKKEAKAPPPPEVLVEQAASQDIPVTFEYAGRTAGSREVEIRSRVSGIIMKRAYVEGSMVKKGQLLFRIDPRPFEAELAKAEASLREAEQDFKRAQSLHTENAISGRDYDMSKSTYEQAKADARTARINLDYTTVTAPINGITSREVFSEGSLVTADTSLLTHLTQLDPLYVNFAMPDSEAMQQREMLTSGKMTLPKDKKLRAEIVIGSGQTYSQEGVIDFTDSIIDTSTGTVRTRAIVGNAKGELMPGQFVRVVVKGFTRVGVITLPAKAVMQGPEGTYVYGVHEGKAKVIPVTLGMLVGERQIIESGLKGGEQIITEGVIRVRPDSPVKVTTAEEAAQKIKAEKQPDAAAPSEKTPAEDATPEEAAEPSSTKD